ncbi:MAG: DUF3015 family protein [Leptospiraceae bacterium]|nr:DUF3015 family protein [Leptospiraceae bacterium]MCP5495150.1 DUF3015 family protein [Leptospiraceae bacterium]
MYRLLLFFLTLLITTLCLNAEPKGSAKYGMAGCGLGSLIIKENKMLPQLGAYTINNFALGTYGVTSSITTGSMNCTADGIVKKQKEQEVYVYLNYENLEREMASGNGEKLETLAMLFGCAKHKSEFAVMAKKNYKKFFSQESDSPAKLVSSINSEIKKDQTLKLSCKI